ncbi:MAG: hypothetical protein ACM3P0_16155 [Acidobacteriota bacterium]
MGLIVSGAISILLAYFIPSVIDLWYTIGTICIPGIIIPVISAYYTRLRIGAGFALAEIVLSPVISLIWYILRAEFTDIPVLSEVEPMIIGLCFAALIHSFGMLFLPKGEKQENFETGNLQ